MRAILDTSVLLAPRFEPIEGELAISAATIAELHFGVLVARDPQVRGIRLAQLAAFERRFAAIPFDSAVASSYGQLAAAVTSLGRNPRGRVIDLMIAATAHAHSARLYTRNAADLAGVEHLVEIVAL